LILVDAILLVKKFPASAQPEGSALYLQNHVLAHILSSGNAVQFTSSQPIPLENRM